jgi:hypothetical protein
MSGPPIDMSELLLMRKMVLPQSIAEESILAIKMVQAVEIRKLNCIWPQTCFIEGIALLK